MAEGYAELLDTNEAAKILRLSSTTLAAWRAKGIGPRYIKFGRRVRYRIEDLLEFLEARTRATDISYASARR